MVTQVTQPINTILARMAGLLNESEQAGGGIVDQRRASNSAAAQLYDQLRSQYEATGNIPTGSYNGGVSPVGQIEPLNQWQQDALTRLQGGAPAMGFMQGVQDAFKGAQGAVSQLPGNLTDQQFQEYYQRFFNPYTQDVVNRTSENIQRQAQIMKNPLKEVLAGNNSFGSTAQGIEYGKIGDAALRNIGDITASLNASGFNSAVNSAMGNYQADTQNAYNRVGAFGNLMGLGVQGNQANQQNFAQNVQNQLYAGDRVQQQNQSLLDVARGQIGAVQQYPYTNLGQFSSLLAPFSGSQGAAYNYAPSNISNLGGLGMFAGSASGQKMFGY